MLHLLLNLIASRLKYKPVPFGLLDLLTQVIVNLLITAVCKSAYKSRGPLGWSILVFVT